jgi:Rrf2 family protein
VRISNKSRCGLRILSQLALDYQSNRLTQARDLAQKQEINAPYLDQLMVTLKKSGLVSAVRGRNGGYRLAVAPQTISVLDIIEVFEGEVNLADDSRDALASVWAELSGSFREAADAITLTDVAETQIMPGPEYVI